MQDIDLSKRYWMRFYSRFFDKHEIKILLDEDRDYVFFYIALLLESVAHRGYVRYNEERPYTPEKLSRLLKMPVDKVVSSIEALKEADLLEILEDGTIFLPQAPAMCGCADSSTERTRRWREGKKNKCDASCDGDVTVCDGDVTSRKRNVTGNIEYRDKSIENIECVSPARSREEVSVKAAPTWEMVLNHIKGPNTPVKIPEDFARVCYDEWVFSEWKDTSGKSIASCWKNKLLFRWRDAEKEQRAKNGGKTDIEMKREQEAHERAMQRLLVEECDD